MSKNTEAAENHQEAQDKKHEISMAALNLALQEWHSLIKQTAGYHTQKAFGSLSDLRGTLKATVHEKLELLKPATDGEDNKYKKIADRVLGAVMHRDFAAVKKAFTDLLEKEKKKEE